MSLQDVSLVRNDMNLLEAIEQGVVIKKTVTPCDECPCHNSDYEQGSWCNLDFQEDHGWTTELKLICCSTDCKLEVIKHSDVEFRKPAAVEVLIGCDKNRFHPQHFGINTCDEQREWADKIRQT